MTDLAIIGASIRTLDPARPHASAVAVRDGIVIAVDSRALASSARRTRSATVP
jgi:predicted amidohydrolase YtcJ